MAHSSEAGNQKISSTRGWPIIFFQFQYIHEDDILPLLTVAVGSSKDFHI